MIANGRLWIGNSSGNCAFWVEAFGVDVIIALRDARNCDMLCKTLKLSFEWTSLWLQSLLNSSGVMRVKLTLWNKKLIVCCFKVTAIRLPSVFTFNPSLKSQFLRDYHKICYFSRVFFTVNGFNNIIAYLTSRRERHPADDEEEEAKIHFGFQIFQNETLLFYYSFIVGVPQSFLARAIKYFNPACNAFAQNAINLLRQVHLLSFSWLARFFSPAFAIAR